MRLPHCDYPSSAEPHRHGLQPLPPELPVSDPEAARPYRSASYRATPAAALTPSRRLQMAQVMADSFRRRDPMLRSLHLYPRAPGELDGFRHTDAYGTSAFGPWRIDTLFTWLIRSCFLTDPSSPASAVRNRDDVLEQSLVILDPDGAAIGGAINETLTHGDAPPVREADPILDTIFGAFEPVFALLGGQESEAVAALEHRYPAFRNALARGAVGHHVLVARGDALPTEDAFELVAATVDRYRDLGFEYVVTSAVNQWTGAAAAALGGVPVHFAHFFSSPRVPAVAAPESLLSSPAGVLSSKDSGVMFYVIRIR